MRCAYVDLVPVTISLLVGDISVWSMPSRYSRRVVIRNAMGIAGRQEDVERFLPRRLCGTGQLGSVNRDCAESDQPFETYNDIYSAHAVLTRGSLDVGRLDVASIVLFYQLELYLRHDGRIERILNRRTKR